MQEGIIFSIEEFAIHDGPGIRTTIFLKGCPLRCVWCHNPEGIWPGPEYINKKGVESLCGYSVTSEELARQMLRNKDIFEMNGGGITLTGGEPLMQFKFVIEFLQKTEALHRVVETSGYAPEEVFREVVKHTDLVLFDVKHMDEAEHRKYTGAGNVPILANLRQLCRGEKEFIVRIPLIPGVNDSQENMSAIAQVLKEAGALQRVELMRYHKTAGAKYAMLGRSYDPPFDTQAAPMIHTGPFEENNIKTIIL